MGALVRSGACGLPVPSGRRTRARLGARWTCSWVPRHSLSLAGKGGCWEVVCTQRRPLPQAGVHPEDAERCGQLPRRGSGRRPRRRWRRQRRANRHRGGALGGGPPEGPWQDRHLHVADEGVCGATGSLSSWSSSWFLFVSLRLQPQAGVRPEAVGKSSPP